MKQESAPDPTPPAAPARFPRWIWVAAFVVLAGLVAFTYSTLRQMRNETKLEKYVKAPEFQFTAQDGTPLSTEALKGKVWVANFIFTRCTGPCPVMTGHMAELNQKLGGKFKDVQLVSITVDPDYDSPAILKEYGERVGAAPAQWKFLTGPTEQVRTVVSKGFLQPLSKDKEGAPMHSTRFILVDRDGWIRGFQEGNDPELIDKLFADIRKLLAE